jgi:hypothetical protein
LGSRRSRETSGRRRTPIVSISSALARAAAAPCSAELAASLPERRAATRLWFTTIAAAAVAAATIAVALTATTLAVAAAAVALAATTIALAATALAAATFSSSSGAGWLSAGATAAAAAALAATIATATPAVTSAAEPLTALTLATHVTSRPIHRSGRESNAAAASSVSIASCDVDHLAAALATAATLDQSGGAHSDRQR